MIFNRYARGGGGGGLGAFIYVTVEAGSTVTATMGTMTRNAVYSQGVYVIDVPAFGDWVVTATKGANTATTTVSVTKAGMYEVTLSYISKTLNDNDWETIKQVSDASAGANYWSVGDTKQITINGKVSDGLTLSNYQTWVYIIGFDHNSAVEGTGIAFGGFKTAQTSGIDVALCDSAYLNGKTRGQWFNMNNSNTNSGGWSSSRMRSTTLSLVKSALPSDLQAVLKTTTIYSDNTGGGSDVASYVTATQDDLYLLAEFEIFGAQTYANSAERNHQQQYAYYVAGNSKVKYRHDSTATAVLWWGRSVRAAASGYFCSVAPDGTANSNAASSSFGLVVAFKVGGAKYTPLEYIQSTGTQYIDTGIRVTPENYQQLKMSVTCEKIGQGSGASNWLVDGSNIANAYFYMGVYNGKYYYGCGTADHDTGIAATSGKQTFTLDIPSSKFTVSDTVDVSISTEPVTASASLYLFGFNYNPVRCYAEKIYSCQIYIGDTLVRDFIAAKDEWGNAGLYDKVEGKFYYNAGTGVFMASGTIGSAIVGQSVYCNVNGVKTEFIVVNQGKPSDMYDDSCNGTWLLMKDIYEKRVWQSGNINKYESSDVNAYLNNTFLNLFDSNIRDAIKQVKIPYRKNGGSGGTNQSGANGLSCKIFLLSGYEVGWTSSSTPVDGAKLPYFESGTGSSAQNKRIAYLNGEVTAWWLRSPDTSDTYDVKLVAFTGDVSITNASSSYGIRPCIILPSDTLVSVDGTIYS